jgi:PadR family transcriptional regulator PadR
VEQLNVQFKKGILELCVLIYTLKKDRYGYELVHSISDKIQIAEGSIYPILRRLTNEGYFATYLAESNEGPPRKYYQLTNAGREYLDQLVSDWNLFSKSVNEIIEEGIYT